MRSRQRRVPGLGPMGNFRRRRSISLGKHATVFQAEVYAMFVCVYEIETQDRQINVLVFALIARRLWKHFRLPKQRLHWYDSAKRRWTISLPGTLWGCTGSLVMREYEEMKSPTSLQGAVLFRRTSPSLGDCRQIIKNKIKRWVDNQDLVMWCGPCSTQRQVRKLISGPSPATKTRLLFFNRTQSRVAIGLTGHNTLRRPYMWWGWVTTPLAGRSVLRTKRQSTFCVSVRIWLHSGRHAYLGYFFMDPEYIMNLNTGAIWNFSKGTGLL